MKWLFPNTFFSESFGITLFCSPSLQHACFAVPLVLKPPFCNSTYASPLFGNVLLQSPSPTCNLCNLQLLFCGPFLQCTQSGLHASLPLYPTPSPLTFVHPPSLSASPTFTTFYPLPFPLSLLSIPSHSPFLFILSAPFSPFS